MRKVPPLKENLDEPYTLRITPTMLAKIKMVSELQVMCPKDNILKPVNFPNLFREILDSVCDQVLSDKSYVWLTKGKPIQGPS